MNFLQLCRKVREESGIAGTNTPTATRNQVGLLGKVVNWTRDAWVEIQREHPNWKFLRRKLDATLTTGTSEYSMLSDLGMSDWRKFDPELCFTFEPGRVSRRPLQILDYSDFVRRYPEIRDGRPTACAVAPGYTLIFNAVPDKDYEVQFHYWMTAEYLDDDEDVPSIPEDLHEVIVWAALIRYGVHEQAVQEKAEWKENYRRALSALSFDQLEIPASVAFVSLDSR